MTQEPQDATIGDEMIQMGRERDFDALDAAWMIQMEMAEPPVDELFRVAQYLVRKNFVDEAGVLLWSLVETMTENLNAPAALKVAKYAAIITPRDRGIRDELVGLYRKVHPENEHLDDIIEASELARTNDVATALKFIDDFLHLRPGAYVRHRMSRRVAKVKGFDLLEYVIEAESHTYRHEAKDVLTYWEPAAEDDFDALVAFEGERLNAMAKENPEELIRMLLTNSPQQEVEFKVLKIKLIPSVIPQAEWTKWWGKAKTAIKRSPWIDLGTGTQPRLTLRKQAAGFAEQFMERFNFTKNVFDKVKLVTEYLGEVKGGQEIDADLARDIGAACAALASKAELAGAFALLTVGQSLHKVCAEAPDMAQPLAEKIHEIEDASDIIQEIPTDDASRNILEAWQEAAPERWPELYAEAFHVGSLRLCDIIARELTKSENEELFIAAAEETTAMPDKSALALGWVWRYILSDGKPLSDRLDPITVTCILLHLMNRMERMPKHAEGRTEARQNLNKLRAIISASDCKLLVNLIESSDRETSRRLNEAFEECEGLREETRHTLMLTLRGAHPEEFAVKLNLWEDGHVYMSQEGIDKCSDALEKITTIDMRAIAIAIGEAAEKGDLRENWEYKAALEERERLVERATRFRAELDRSRQISVSMLSGDEANVGTTLTLRKPDGAERSLTFLGPWDADIANGTYSYLAPLSQKFMGKKVGDKVEASFDEDHAEYEIVAIAISPKVSGE
jgi:transcription elongation factor GreA